MIRRSIGIVVLLLLCYSYVLPRWMDWSQTSRLALVRALVEQGTVRIDSYVETTGDYALYQGHYYSDKAPGPALLAAPFYAVIQPALRLEPVQHLLGKLAGSGALAATARDGALGIERVELALNQLLLTMLVVALPVALALALFDRLLLRWFRPGPALATTLGVGLGTPLAPYAGNFYSHALVAGLLIAAWALVEFAADRTRRRTWLPVASGLLLGLAAISEYPAVLAGGLVGCYAIWRLGWRSVPLLVLGSLPPLAALTVYDWIAFGTVLPIGYAYSALWQEQHHTGFMSLTYPRPAALWGLSGGLFRGLFVRAPWLLLALPGAVLWWRYGRERAPLLLALAVSLALWLFYSSSRMWWGGFAAGPRYIVALVPFLALPVAYVFERGWDRTWLRALLIAATCTGVLLVWSEALAGQMFPRDDIANPWLGQTIPAWAGGDVARNVGMALGLHGAASLLPLIVAAALLLLLLLWPPHSRTSARRVEPASVLG